jgi:hypothetical protein
LSDHRNPPRTPTEHVRFARLHLLVMLDLERMLTREAEAASVYSYASRDGRRRERTLEKALKHLDAALEPNDALAQARAENTALRAQVRHSTAELRRLAGPYHRDGFGGKL